MLELIKITKKFSLKQAAKLNQQSDKDSRIQGRFFHALTQVSFSLDKSEVFGLLGANGAGKTTLLRVLSTALTANSGQIIFNGQPVEKSVLDYRKQIGFLSGTTGLYERLSGYENLVYFAKLYAMDEAQLKSRIDELSELLDLDSFIHRRLSDYSTGMKQRLAIARCVLHSPKLVILDEPTTGLDIVAKEVILKFIEAMKQQNVTIIFSTHDMAEVERLCNRVGIIHQGQNQFVGTIEELKQQTNTTQLQQALFKFMDVSDSNQSNKKESSKTESGVC